MTPQDFEAAVLAQTAFKLSMSDSVDEQVAIACVIRNLVVPKPGCLALYKSFPAACTDLLRAYPAREDPTMQEDAMVAPNGLLSLIGQIYDCSYPDITATQTTPGARMFARTANLEQSDWRWPLVRSARLLGNWGSQSFYFL